MGMRRWGYVGPWCRGLCEELPSTLSGRALSPLYACQLCLAWLTLNLFSKNDFGPALWQNGGRLFPTEILYGYAALGLCGALVSRVM